MSKAENASKLRSVLQVDTKGVLASRQDMLMVINMQRMKIEQLTKKTLPPEKCRSSGQRPLADASHLKSVSINGLIYLRKTSRRTEDETSLQVQQNGDTVSKYFELIR